MCLKDLTDKSISAYSVVDYVSDGNTSVQNCTTLVRIMFFPNFRQIGNGTSVICNILDTNPMTSVKIFVAQIKLMMNYEKSTSRKFCISSTSPRSAF